MGISKPRYPIYIPSKGRWDRCSTTLFLVRDRVPFSCVVEQAEAERYAGLVGEERVLVLPFSDAGSVIPARNWIKQHATSLGAERHWQLDDNIHSIRRRGPEGRQIPTNSGIALAAVEDWVDRYQNIAVAGLNEIQFALKRSRVPPFYLNQRVYSCSLILNSLPHRWRGRYNEDTDLCLQVIGDGWCTALVNTFLMDKATTMMVKGGNTQVLYQGDGRLKMARSLERLWPGVVETRRRFQRPQHVVKNSWKGFDTPLKLKPGIDLGSIPPNDYGLKLVEVKPVKSERLKQLLAEEQARESGLPTAS